VDDSRRSLGKSKSIVCLTEKDLKPRAFSSLFNIHILMCSLLVNIRMAIYSLLSSVFTFRHILFLLNIIRTREIITFLRKTTQTLNSVKKVFVRSDQSKIFTIR